MTSTSRNPDPGSEFSSRLCFPKRPNMSEATNSSVQCAATGESETSKKESSVLLFRGKSTCHDVSSADDSSPAHTLTPVGMRPNDEHHPRILVLRGRRASDDPQVGEQALRAVDSQVLPQRFHVIQGERAVVGVVTCEILVGKNERSGTAAGIDTVGYAASASRGS